MDPHKLLVSSAPWLVFYVFFVDVPRMNHHFEWRNYDCRPLRKSGSGMIGPDFMGFWWILEASIPISIHFWYSVGWLYWMLLMLQLASGLHPMVRLNITWAMRIWRPTLSSRRHVSYLKTGYTWVHPKLMKLIVSPSIKWWFFGYSVVSLFLGPTCTMLWCHLPRTVLRFPWSRNPVTKMTTWRFFRTSRQIRALVYESMIIYLILTNIYRIFIYKWEIMKIKPY